MEEPGAASWRPSCGTWIRLALGACFALGAHGSHERYVELLPGVEAADAIPTVFLDEPLAVDGRVELSGTVVVSGAPAVSALTSTACALWANEQVELVDPWRFVDDSEEGLGWTREPTVERVKSVEAGQASVLVVGGEPPRAVVLRFAGAPALIGTEDRTAGEWGDETWGHAGKVRRERPAWWPPEDGGPGAEDRVVGGFRRERLIEADEEVSVLGGLARRAEGEVVRVLLDGAPVDVRIEGELTVELVAGDDGPAPTDTLEPYARSQARVDRWARNALGLLAALLLTWPLTPWLIGRWLRRGQHLEAWQR